MEMSLNSADIWDFLIKKDSYHSVTVVVETAIDEREEDILAIAADFAGHKSNERRRSIMLKRGVINWLTQNYDCKPN